MPKLKTNRIGETHTMNCDLKATIIEYNNAMDITVQFETGEIIQHKQYNNFKKGTISPHNYRGKRKLNKYARKHIGETKIMNCGSKATIVEYNGAKDITVQFETSEIVQHKRYDKFKQGKIAPYNYDSSKEQSKQYAQKRIGETRTMNCGLNATIIEYHNFKNIDIQFETNEIVQHKMYNAFTNGQIAPHNYDLGKEQLKQYVQKRIGETRTMNCGLKATIIKYRNARDIDVQFETGEIIQHKTYDAFKKSYISNIVKTTIHKTNRINETKIMNCGLKATIIEYRNIHDIDVQFENNIIIQHKIYKDFTKGYISPITKTINDISIGQFVTVKDDKWYYVCKHPKWNKPRILSIPEIYAYKGD